MNKTALAALTALLAVSDPGHAQAEGCRLFGFIPTQMPCHQVFAAGMALSNASRPPVYAPAPPAPNFAPLQMVQPPAAPIHCLRISGMVSCQ